MRITRTDLALEGVEQLRQGMAAFCVCQRLAALEALLEKA